MVNFEMFLKPTIAKLAGSRAFYHGFITTKMRSEHKLRAGKSTVILGEWNGESFLPIKNQKPGMVLPLQQADGLIVTTKEVDYLAKGQEVKMIPIKVNLKSEERKEFFVE